MTTPMRVMLIESHAGSASSATRELEAAGHQVLRCFGSGQPSFPCWGITHPEACPIAERADVALIVRRGVNPRPTGYEVGVSCAVRAGVPVVEDGVSILDPYDKWVTARSGDDVVSACEAAIATADKAITDTIRRHIGIILERAGVDQDAVSIRLTRGERLHVGFDGPALGTQQEQAIGVRVLDAVRTVAPALGPVDVSYDHRLVTAG